MIASRNQRFAVLIITSGCFAVLLVLVWKGETNTFDITLRNWALSFNTPTIVAVWEGISFMGSVVVLSSLTFLSMGLFAMRRDWSAVRQIAFAMGGAVGLDTLIKWVVHRPRPEEVYAHTMPASYSFPSGHALYSFMFYLTIAAIVSRQNLGNGIRGFWGSAIVIIVSIGASRIFLGVHYSSDVVGGYLIAAIWLNLVSVLTTVD